MAGLIGLAVRGVASGIGLASEAHTAHKNKKKAKAEQARLEPSAENIHDRSSPSPDKHDEGALHTEIFELDTGTDEVNWQLDEAQDELSKSDAASDLPSAPPPPYEFPIEPDIPVTHTNMDEPSDSQEPTTIASQVPFFLSKHKPPPAHVDYDPMPFPVVLPQRRPKDRTRGFIRAYPPALDDHDITEGMFIDFIETFDRASQASPWIQSVNLATVFTSVIPEGINIAVNATIRMATKAAIEMQARKRTSTFLDEINQGFFQPRGLFALVMTWDPNSRRVTESHLLNAKIEEASRARSPSGFASRARHSFQPSTATTFELPETAPLVYPKLDSLATSDSAEAQDTKNRLSSGKEFLANYMDRRAQAGYQRNNPTGMLAQGPKPTFSSRYADPASSAASGDLAALVTGGKVNLTSGRRRGRGGLLGGGRGLKHMSMDGSVDNRRRSRGPLAAAISGVNGVVGGPNTGAAGSSNVSSSRAQGRTSVVGQGRRGIGSLKKVLQQDVLYLLIVNMPTDEELAQTGPVELPAD